MLPALRCKKRTTQIGFVIWDLKANRGVHLILFQAWLNYTTGSAGGFCFINRGVGFLL